MTDQRLLENVSRLGVPMMAPEGQLDVNKTLADVVKSGDTRYWEAVPVLLANAHKTGTLDVEKVEAYLPGKADRRTWRGLLKMSLALYPVMKGHFEFAKEMERGLSAEEKKWVEGLRNKARARGGKGNFSLENREFNFSRMKGFLDNYLQDEALKMQKARARYNEFSLEYALSQVFSPKQKELFQKKLKGEPLTKTEREYFSRAVKKKALALANDELHALARQVVL